MKLTYIYAGRKNSDRQKPTALAASLFGAGKLAEDIECVFRERSLPKRLDLRTFEVYPKGTLRVNVWNSEL